MSFVPMTKVFHIGYIIEPMPHPIDNKQKVQLKKLGERIKAIRIEKGLTLEEVGNRIGKDRQSIHSLEKGSFNPSYLYLIDICRGLEIEVIELF